MSSKTQPARGMRDFLPADVRKRNYVIGIIKEVYEKYGFEPLETPSVENLETLTGKYGEEGNQLMFKILKRGEKLQEELSAGSVKNENELSDLALRYDLTVPLARVVANYRNELPKFFKRYQIQPVWRADRPAKGRYREFYQCDVDAIGSSSMIVEAELCAAVSEILERLGFEKFKVQLNSRKLLSAVLNISGIENSLHNSTLTVLDKYEKIGFQGVKRELTEKGIPEDKRNNLLEFFEMLNRMSINYDVSNLNSDLWSENIFSNWNQRILDLLEERLDENSDEESLEEIREIIDLCKQSYAGKRIFLNLNLVRGLSYYTGAIFEVNVPGFAGSLAGGGRYDGLIGMFGKEQIPACGFSLGLERILVVMEERGMFQKLIDEGKLKSDAADVLVTILEKKETNKDDSINQETLISESLKLANELRAENLRVLVYPEADKLGKQFKYADALNIPLVCVLGETELAGNEVTLKNMRTGEQQTILRGQIAEKIKENTLKSI